MYKLLLADDERIIREGIVTLIDWNSLFINVSQAKDGYEAYEIIKNERPDIVITDIKMPGLNGLELIEKVKVEYPDTIFVILSGYGEFEFASLAMQFGVKYYLLKPCDENDIIDVIEKIINEFNDRKQKEKFINDMKDKWNKILPHIREQFLRDCIMHRFSIYQQQEYLNILDISIENIQLILFSIDMEFKFDHVFAVKNLAEDILGSSNIIFSTIMGSHVLVLIEPLDFNSLIMHLKDIKKTFYRYYQIDVTIAVSDESKFEQLPFLYNQTREYLKYRFYLGSGSIITNRDIKVDFDNSKHIFIFDYERIMFAIKTGNIEELSNMFNIFFDELRRQKYEIITAKTYCMELYMIIIRQACETKLDEYMQCIVVLQEIDTIDSISVFIFTIAREITIYYYEKNTKNNSAIIKAVIEHIERNIGNEQLSLSWLSREILYMNEDYVGKLFKKEMNEKFSHYLNRIRMEKAKRLIEGMPDDTIIDIAEKVGYGNNPQYFGQVFKKYTGYTPSEYSKELIFKQ